MMASQRRQQILSSAFDAIKSMREMKGSTAHAILSYIQNSPQGRQCNRKLDKIALQKLLKTATDSNLLSCERGRFKLNLGKNEDGKALTRLHAKGMVTALLRKNCKKPMGERRKARKVVAKRRRRGFGKSGGRGKGRSGVKRRSSATRGKRRRTRSGSRSRKGCGTKGGRRRSRSRTPKGGRRRSRTPKGTRRRSRTPKGSRRRSRSRTPKGSRRRSRSRTPKGNRRRSRSRKGCGPKGNRSRSRSRSRSASAGGRRRHRSRSGSKGRRTRRVGVKGRRRRRSVSGSKKRRSRRRSAGRKGCKTGGKKGAGGKKAKILPKSKPRPNLKGANAPKAITAVQATKTPRMKIR